LGLSATRNIKYTSYINALLLVRPEHTIIDLLINKKNLIPQTIDIQSEIKTDLCKCEMHRAVHCDIFL